MKRLLCVFLIGLFCHPQFMRAADSAADVDARVDALLTQMTLEEKVAQMDMFFLDDLHSPANQPLMNSIGVGSVRGDSSPEIANQMQADAEKTRLKIPVLFAEMNKVIEPTEYKVVVGDQTAKFILKASLAGN